MNRKKNSRLKKKSKEKSDFTEIDDLKKIKGIGAKAITDLKKHYKTIGELKDALSNDKVSLRDDQEEILRKHFGIK